MQSQSPVSLWTCVCCHVWEYIYRTYTQAWQKNEGSSSVNSQFAEHVDVYVQINNFSGTETGLNILNQANSMLQHWCLTCLHIWTEYCTNIISSTPSISCRQNLHKSILQPLPVVLLNLWVWIISRTAMKNTVAELCSKPCSGFTVYHATWCPTLHTSLQ